MTKNGDKEKKVYQIVSSWSKKTQMVRQKKVSGIFLWTLHPPSWIRLKFFKTFPLEFKKTVHQCQIVNYIILITKLILELDSVIIFLLPITFPLKMKISFLTFVITSKLPSHKSGTFSSGGSITGDLVPSELVSPFLFLYFYVKLCLF